jgi:phage terminase small subunit
LTDADKGLVRALCQIQTLGEECYARVRNEGIMLRKDKPHPLIAEFRQLVKVEADLAGRLGLSPREALHRF